MVRREQMQAAERRRRDQRIILRRLRQLTRKTGGPGLYSHKDIAQPHRLHKKPAFGCRVANCRICRRKR